MTKIRVTKEFTFEAAHALQNYDGACKHIHGHSYRLFVTVIGTPCSDSDNPKCGMVLDFGELKKIVMKRVVDRYDHSLVLRATEADLPLYEMIKERFSKVEIVNYQPTCENMISRYASDIQEDLPEGVELFSLRLHETATSYAEWFKADNQ